MASENYPTAELIEQARQDYYYAALSRGAGRLSLTEATELAAKFAATATIRNVRIPRAQGEMLDISADAHRSNRAVKLDGALTAIIQNPDIVLDGIATLRDISAANITAKTACDEYPLNPDVFVPLAELAQTYRVSSSTLAILAVTEAFTRPS